MIVNVKPSYRILVVIILMFISCKRQEVEVSYYPNGSIKDSAQVIGKMRVGRYTSYYPNGSLKSTGNFLNDEFDGEWKYYYRNGEIKSVQVYDNGEIEDINFWSKKGKLLVKNGTGTLITKYESGGKELEQTFLKNELHGRSRAWYKNGKLELIFYYFRGRPCGTWSYYDRNGDLKRRMKHELDCE